MSQSVDIAVIGAGLSGLLSAIALSDRDHGPGCSVALIDSGPLRRERSDGRATTLTPSAIRMLSRLGVGGFSGTHVHAMRVGEGDADTPWQFELPERPDTSLAVVVENDALRDALLARLKETDVNVIETVGLADLDIEGRAKLTLTDGSFIDAGLVVAADGRNSAVRRMAGLSVTRTEFGQHALVTTVIHAEPHEGIALQRFQSVGAIASLPLATTQAGHRSQIVWSDREPAIAAACALDADALLPLIDERLWGALEITGLDAAVQSYPLIDQRSEALSAERIALVGDAARAVHPLAGQGFNLAVRDIAALTETVRDAAMTGQDIGTAGLIGYARWRRVDEALLAGVTQALSAAPKRGPLSLLGHARRLAFATVDAVPALHPFIRQEAIGETGERPPLLL